MNTGTLPATLKIQPVEPEKPTPADLGGRFVVGIAFPFLAGLFLMLAFGTLHDLWPSIPSVGYWQAVTLVLGLNVIKLGLRSPVWKWARR